MVKKYDPYSPGIALTIVIQARLHGDVDDPISVDVSNSRTHITKAIIIM